MGSHVADALSEAGHNVTIYDRIESPYLRPDQKMVIGDLTFRRKLFHELRKIDVVYHLAALCDINVTWSDPHATIQANVVGTANILEAMRLNGVKKIVFASTLYVESRAGGLYRATKQAGEELVKTYYQYAGIDYLILRFGTLYGTRAKENNGMYKYLKQALLEGKIDHYGTGNEVREFIHVKDCAKICVSLLEKFGTPASQQTLILTGYHRIRIFELLEMINEVLNKKIEVIYHPEDNRCHYDYLPYSYIPQVASRIIPDTYLDFGGSLVEMLEEINKTNKKGDITQEVSATP